MIRVLVPTNDAGFILVDTKGAHSLRAEPQSLCRDIIEAYQGVKDMKILHGEVTGFSTKLVGDYIELCSLPANARVARYTFGLKGGSMDMNTLVGNNISDDAYAGSPGVAFTFFIVADPVSVMTWKKETEATTMRLKIDGKTSVPSGSVIEYWVEYIQE